jgi:hypothetical protein
MSEDLNLHYGPGPMLGERRAQETGEVPGQGQTSESSFLQDRDPVSASALAERTRYLYFLRREYLASRTRVEKEVILSAWILAQKQADEQAGEY